MAVAGQESMALLATGCGWFSGAETKITHRMSIWRGMRTTYGLALIVLLVTAVQWPASASGASPVDDGFDPGYIIDDSDFYSASAMSEGEIQSFLESQESGSCATDLCLKSLTLATTASSVAPAKDGATLCAPYAAAAAETASRIIYNIQRACGISARVILVTLQKEQSLVTSLDPTPAALQRAMGYACPDSGTCAATTLGFQNQVYVAASQFQRYRHSTTFGQPGLRSIRYSPKATCGRLSVVVANYATAALYDYTPYTPDAAARDRVPGGRGDTCSSFGNHNFSVLYRRWFGGPSGDPQGGISEFTASSTSVSVQGWAIDPNAPRKSVTVRVCGSGWCLDARANGIDFGSLATFAGSGFDHGFLATVQIPPGSRSVCVVAVNEGPGTDTTLGCTRITPPARDSIGA
jgi:hypothetical protein